MGCLQVEIVAGSIKVDRQQINSVHAVLLAVRLALNEQCLLGNSIRRVRLFRIAIPERFFAEWYRREFRVGTRGARHDGLCDAVTPGVFEQLNAHDGILVKELPRIAPVRTDSPDDSR